MTEKNYVLTREAAHEKLHRMALEIAEDISGEEVPLVLIGIRRSGMVIAEKIGAFLQRYVPVHPHIMSVVLDKHLPSEVELSEQMDFNDKNVILVDDVSNSGRTLLYALKPILNYHPNRVQVLVLVERMHKQFPIKPDFVGVSIATTVEDYIRVVVENDDIQGAYVESVTAVV